MSTNIESTTLPTCPQCSKTFFRKAHMLRHLQQHTGTRPYRCQFCSKTFKRSDVLRDHFQRCDRRGNFPIPKQEERGRKRHACDHCARLKVKCDNEMPCQKCKDFGRTCVKSRPKVANSPEETAGAEITTSDRSSINFLLNCPADTEFTQRFPPDSTVENSSPSVSNNSATDYTVYSDAEAFGQPYKPMTNDSGFPCDFEMFDSTMSLDNFLASPPFGPGMGWDIQHLDLSDTIIQPVHSPEFIGSPDLENYATQLRHKLETSAACFPSSSPTDLHNAIQLIRGQTLDHFVKLFFRNWWKHGPMIHQPSFNIFQVELPLLFGVICVGGLYSKNTEEVAQLRVLLDLIEFSVFNNPPFSDDYIFEQHQHVDKTPDEKYRARLEEVQGAHLMVVAQYWAGNQLARKRARKQRWARLVSVAREVRASALPLLQSDVYIQDETSFRRWILQQSYCRYFNILMMLDNAFVIFNNVPSHVEWFEVGDLEFFCEESFFQMATYEEVYNSACVPQRRLKIIEAFQALFVPDLRNDKAELTRLATLSGFDLLNLVHRLYVHIWRQTFANPTFGVQTIPVASIVKPLKLSLQNWKIVWDQLRLSLTSEEWAGLGFERMAEMYWNLTKEVVIVFEKGNTKDYLPILCDCETGSHLRRLLKI